MPQTQISERSKKQKKLYFPPLMQFAFYGLAGYILATNLPALAYGSVPLFWLSVPVIAAGALVLFFAVRSFGRANTTVNPITPEQAEQLVTTGLYRFTRNPMYLGMLLVLVGGALALQNLAAFSGPILYALSITLLQIIPEERVLEQNFGSAFTAYRKQTRRWL